MDVIPAPATETAASASQPTLVRGLSLLDSVLLLVSGIIGSSIFLTAKDIAGPLPQPMLFLLVWVTGGVVSLFGCVAFAELGSMFPESGGQYVYLREAYGDLVAFLYGWMLFAVANGGTIAALSVASAAYAGQVFPIFSPDHVVLSLAGIVLTRAHLFALLLIAIVTYVNVVGLRWGALLQNLSTWTKFAAMAAFVVLGFAIGKGDWSHFESHGVGLTMGLHPAQLISAMGVALIAVFWAYDGWVYITWVAGEVKEPRRNVPLAMVLGVLVVGAIY
ncbi:MAG: amino acid permease, partial [Candidatus Sulfotelmatobacter sp.]